MVLSTRPQELQDALGKAAAAWHHVSRTKLDPANYADRRGDREFWDTWLRTRAREIDVLPEHLRSINSGWLDCCALFAELMSRPK
jgi:hypothetical protein